MITCLGVFSFSLIFLMTREAAFEWYQVGNNPIYKRLNKAEKGRGKDANADNQSPTYFYRFCTRYHTLSGEQSIPYAKFCVNGSFNTLALNLGNPRTKESVETTYLVNSEQGFVFAQQPQTQKPVNFDLVFKEPTSSWMPSQMMKKEDEVILKEVKTKPEQFENMKSDTIDDQILVPTNLFSVRQSGNKNNIQSVSVGLNWLGITKEPAAPNGSKSDPAKTSIFWIFRDENRRCDADKNCPLSMDQIKQPNSEPFYSSAFSSAALKETESLNLTVKFYLLFDTIFKYAVLKPTFEGYVYDTQIVQDGFINGKFEPLKIVPITSEQNISSVDLGALADKSGEFHSSVLLVRDSKFNVVDALISEATVVPGVTETKTARLNFSFSRKFSSNELIEYKKAVEKGYEVSLTELDFLQPSTIRPNPRSKLQDDLLAAINKQKKTFVCNVGSVKDVKLFDDSSNASHFICLPGKAEWDAEKKTDDELDDEPSCKLSWFHFRLKEFIEKSEIYEKFGFLLKISGKVLLVLPKIETGVHFCSNGLNVYLAKITNAANAEDPNKLMTEVDLRGTNSHFTLPEPPKNNEQKTEEDLKKANSDFILQKLIVI